MKEAHSVNLKGKGKGGGGGILRVQGIQEEEEKKDESIHFHRGA